MYMTKEDAKERLARDFMPNGKRIDDISSLKFVETGPFEIYRCCCRIGSDPQSGPFYCGDVADFKAFVGDGSMVSVCQKHFERIKPFLKGDNRQ
jgi:hypothetical protein